MKSYNRAYNRQQKQIKFIKRVKNWFNPLSDVRGDKQHFLDLTLKGKHFTFLKTTSRPCNCDMCTYLKYKRMPKHKIIRDALNE